jgi:hypothetical protein
LKKNYPINPKKRRNSNYYNGAVSQIYKLLYNKSIIELIRKRGECVTRKDEHKSN